MPYQASGYNNASVAEGKFHQEDDHRVEVVESNLVHPVNSPVMSNNGDTVSFGTHGTGVRVGADSTAETDRVVIQTRGIVNISVDGDDGSPLAIDVGDPVFIGAAGFVDGTVAGILFGIALEPVASGATTLIAVRLAGITA